MAGVVVDPAALLAHSTQVAAAGQSASMLSARAIGPAAADPVSVAAAQTLSAHQATIAAHTAAGAVVTGWRGELLGGPHPDPPQVVVQVDFAVLQPHRTMQLERDVNELVAQRFQQVQPAAQRAAKQIKAEVTLEVSGVNDGNLEGACARWESRCTAAWNPCRSAA